MFEIGMFVPDGREIVEGETLVSIGSTVRSRRKALGLTQTDLADLAGCSERFVRFVEAGKATVRVDKLLAVLDALGLELSVGVRSVA